MSRYVSFGVLLAVIAILCILFYKILAGFLVPLFLAALLVVIFRPLHAWVVERCKGREKIAALLTTLAILLVVLIPIAILTSLAVIEGKQAAESFNSGAIVLEIKKLRKSLGLFSEEARQIHEIDDRFDDLREHWGSKDLELHQEIWFEIRQYSERLEKQVKKQLKDQNGMPTKLGISWKKFNDRQVEVDEEVDEEIDEEVEEEVGDSQEKIDLDELRTEIIEMSEVDDNDPDIFAKLAIYHDGIDKIEIHFTDFKDQLFGGRILANIKQLANPTEKEEAAYGESIVDFFRSKLFSFGEATTAFTFNLIFGAAIMIISLYFFLLDGPSMILTIQHLSPLDDEHESELVKEFGLVSRAVVVATLLSAVVQGLLAGIGYYFCGFDSVMLLMLITTAMALVPFFGAASVWIPASLYLFFIDNNVPAAIGLAIYGAAIISMADNVIKPFILHGQSNIHPLLALLSILGGIAALGPIGLLVGPMVVAFLQTLLKILHSELTSMENSSEEATE